MIALFFMYLYCFDIHLLFYKLLSLIFKINTTFDMYVINDVIYNTMWCFNGFNDIKTLAFFNGLFTHVNHYTFLDDTNSLLILTIFLFVRS